MEPRGGEQPPQRAEVEAHVGVDERRLDAHERHVGEQRPVREAEHVDRDVGEAAGDRHVHEVQPRAGQPVHRRRGMVDGVEAPQRGHAVERAVDPVLGEVGEDEDRRELERARQRGDRGRDPRVARAQSKKTMAGFSVSSVITWTSSELTKKYARSVRQARRNTGCSGRSAKRRSRGTKTAE